MRRGRRHPIPVRAARRHVEKRRVQYARAVAQFTLGFGARAFMCVHLLHKGGPPSSVVDARRAATTRRVPSETKKIPSLRHVIGHQIARCERSSEAIARWRCLWLAWCGDIGYCARGLAIGRAAPLDAEKLTSTMLERILVCGFTRVRI